MPTLTVDTVGRFEVVAGSRLVTALEAVAGQDQLHSCGGVGKCTSCRVEFLTGEPSQVTTVELELLKAKGLFDSPGVRLSCQMTCERDMTVRVISRLAGSTKKDTGTPCKAEIEPPPTWVEMPRVVRT